MKRLNLFASDERLSSQTRGCAVTFGSVDKTRSDAGSRGLFQSISNSLCRRGFDATVAPFNKTNEFDLALIGVFSPVASKALEGYSNLSPKIVESDFGRDVISAAWSDRVRIRLQQGGFIRSGSKYFRKESLLTTYPYKDAFNVQADIVDGRPSVWVDTCTRIITPLSDGDISKASRPDSPTIGVRVLPYWSYGILFGKGEKKAGETVFNFNGRELNLPTYWKTKHGIDFVKVDDDTLVVAFPPEMKKMNYPRSCVFKEYLYGSRLPSNLKKSPYLRVNEVVAFVKTQLENTTFLGRTVRMIGLKGPEEVGFREHFLGVEPSMLLSNNQSTVFRSLSASLRSSGPYTGPLNGKYFIIHPGQRDETLQALKEIEKTYIALRLGNLEILRDVGDGGLIDTGGTSVTDYTSAIISLRMKLESKMPVIGVVVLPESNPTDLYFRARQQLFERLYDTPPFPVQAIKSNSLRAINMGDKSSLPICVNTAAQLYIKLGGTGAALWILNQAADSTIPGITAGTSCYAYHDVSRRTRLKSSATAYSALTDSYGRYIATGTKPVGGERLTEGNFYDILVELIQKISMFSQKYKKIDEKRAFAFSRLVFAKDGVIRKGEAKMMENVIINGIPAEQKEPIANLLKKTSILPKDLVIDIIGVNKSPSKRIFELGSQGYNNVEPGTTILYNDDEGLLVSSGTYAGTAQPIEITLHKHICLNNASVPTPNISQILDEYYRLTFLNWSSIFKKSKLALPQILTQNLGENLTAGVMVPDNMVLL